MRMNKRVIKICDRIFTNEIIKAKLNMKNFDYKKYERELYHSAIKSFKKSFMKKLKEVNL